MAVNTKGRDAAQSSQSKEKETMAVELSGTVQPKQKSNTNGNQEFKFLLKVYSLKDEQLVTIFHLLHKGNKLKLPEVWQPNEVGHTKMPTTASFTEWCIISLANALSSRTRFKWTLEFWLSNLNKRKSLWIWWLSILGPSRKQWSKMEWPVPKARLDVISLMTEVQKAKDLILMTIKSGEIMWVHPDIVNDEQWESKQA